MNPSQFPQVIRSRSRSPSPSWRSNVHKRDNGDAGRSRYLDVPDIDHFDARHAGHASHTLRRSRSYSDYPVIHNHRSRRHRLNAGRQKHRVILICLDGSYLLQLLCIKGKHVLYRYSSFISNFVLN